MSVPSRVRTRGGSRSTWLIVGAVVLLAVILIVLLRPRSSTLPLDPGSPAPDGALALATLLAERGVAVELTRSAEEAIAAEAATTLLVADSSLLSEEVTTRILQSQAGSIVILGPGPLSESLGLELVPEQPDGSLAADCTLEAAVRAGEATFTSVLDGPGEVCFAADSGAGLHRSGNRTVLASDTPLLNESLAESGNAALSINLLAQSRSVTWYLPDPNDPALLTGGSTSVTDLLPPWVYLLACQGLLIFVAATFAHARRLGPLVTEDLPVLVSAQETDIGLANLWQQQRAFETAAAQLRGSTWAELETILGPAGEQVLMARAAKRSGLTTGRVAELFEAPVTSEQSLITLRTELAHLSARVSSAPQVDPTSKYSGTTMNEVRS